jgi:peptidyl-dipeptidase Dcp
MSNPLLQVFETPYGTAPFSKIKNEHFAPAIEAGIALAKEEINTIIANPSAPTFENTIEALDFSGSRLARISSIFFNLNSAETNDEIQKIAQEISPLLTEFSNDITLNIELFNRVKAVFSQKEKLKLTTEQLTLLEKKYKSFVRNGANLSGQEKEKLRDIDKRLAKLKLKFGENVLAETHAFELHLLKKSELKGLPDSAIEAARLQAKQRNKKGWVFTLDYPSYIPFMTYSDSRELRRKMALAFGARGFQKNDNNNEQIVLELVKLRGDRAHLLGYPTHSDFVLEERMAEKPNNVNEFLQDLLGEAKPAALREYKDLSILAKKEGVELLEKWDSAYYSEKLKKKLFNFDQEKLKPYFKLENVIDGVFQVSNKLFDLVFEEVFDIDTYHEDVKTYKVSDADGAYIAILYADFFPRKGKRNGAWMTSFKGQWEIEGNSSRPHISIVCNFTKPTENKPSLLTFNEVTTLFHEFGHALHGMLANTKYPSISGTNVPWDFVELPSQILENWCYEKEALNLFASHYITHEVLPMEMIDKIKASSNFLEGMQTMRQLSFALLDMHWHGAFSSEVKSVKEFESSAFESTRLFPEVNDNCMSTAFSHIFQGGYSSGYYSYKWAEVLDADAFSLFQEKGIFDKNTSDKFKLHILEKGGTEKPMDLYLKFRGQKPSNKALLKRAGLLK